MASVETYAANPSGKLIGGSDGYFFFGDGDLKRDVAISRMQPNEVCEILAKHLTDDQIMELGQKYVISYLTIIPRPEVSEVRVFQVINSNSMLAEYGKSDQLGAFEGVDTRKLGKGDVVRQSFYRDGAFRYETILNSTSQVPKFKSVSSFSQITRENLSLVYSPLPAGFSVPKFKTVERREYDEQIQAIRLAEETRARIERIHMEKQAAEKARQEAARRREDARNAQSKLLNFETDMAVRDLKQIDSQLAAKPDEHNRKYLEERKAAVLRKMDQISRQLAELNK